MLKTFKEFVNLELPLETMYMRRNLLNTEQFVKWFKDQGFVETVTPEEIHVTIAYSKQKMNWNAVQQNSNELISEGGKRSVIPLGDKGAVVLKFEDDNLQRRWQEIRDAGASWDYEGYQPHCTITYKNPGLDLSTIKPYEGPLVFGPELRNVLDENWGSKVKHEEVELDGNKIL